MKKQHTITTTQSIYSMALFSLALTQNTQYIVNISLWVLWIVLKKQLHWATNASSVFTWMQTEISKPKWLCIIKCKLEKNTTFCNSKLPTFDMPSSKNANSPRSLMTLGWSNSFMQAASLRKSSISERVHIATGEKKVQRWSHITHMLLSR